MDKKQQFYQDALPFFESGILKNIYENDELTICNLANKGYCAFNYIKTKDGQAGIIINPVNVKEIVSDPSFYNRLIAELDRRDMLDERIFALNKKTFEIMTNMKKQTDIAGPSPDIDLQMEEELMAKYKSR